MSPPVGFTQALPRLHAGAVHAAGMRDALIAVLALPAVETTATQKPRDQRDPAKSQQLHSSQVEVIPVGSENVIILISHLFLHKNVTDNLSLTGCAAAQRGSILTTGLNL